jgi:hypothetical protein
MGKFKRSEVAKMPDNKKVTAYAGGELRTITARQLKKYMGIKSNAQANKTTVPNKNQPSKKSK